MHSNPRKYLGQLGGVRQHHFVAATDADHLPVSVEGAVVYELLIGIGEPVRREDVGTPEDLYRPSWQAWVVGSVSVRSGWGISCD